MRKFKAPIVILFIILVCFVDTLFADNPQSIQSYFVLTTDSEPLTLPSGSHVQVFGSTGSNIINIEAGARVQCLNFVGSNEINIEEVSSLFTVYRSGATVYLNSSTGTLIQIAATLTSQTIQFADGSSELVISDGNVILGSRIVSGTEAGVLTEKTGTLPDLAVFTFTARESKILQGNSTELNTDGWGCDGVIGSMDTIDRLALVSLFYQNGCYTDGQYNHNNYFVECGTVSDAAGQSRFQAYTIHEPAHKASQFLASEHAVYYRFPTCEDYTVYRFSGGNFSTILNVSAARIDTSSFIKLDELTASRVSGSVTYLFVPAAQRVSVYAELNSEIEGGGVEGGRIKSTDLGDLLKYRYRINGTLFDTRSGFDYGPDTWKNRYSSQRHFFPVMEEGELGVVWQDTSDTSIHLTWLGNGLVNPVNISLRNTRAEILVAAVGDEIGSIYYLTIQGGDGSEDDGSEDDASEDDASEDDASETKAARTATLYKMSSSGGTVISSILDTSRSGLNIVSFSDSITYTADLKYSNGLLGFMLGRKMHRSSDGLNHQGGIAVVFDAANLSLLKNHGQTSGHSFGNVLCVNADGKFVGIDLGDNYPRGINLHRFDTTDLISRVVYTFKTAHGTIPANPAGVTYPLYSAISGTETTYYQWSNDNNTYTELGGVIEGNSGYTVVFSGEQLNGESLANNLVGELLNVPRNIGLVQVISNFQQKDWSDPANVVTDDLVLSSGPSETAGFYTFNGDWEEQRNTGVICLTDYSDLSTENVSRLKTARLIDGTILLLWEKWTQTSYVNTYAMKIDEDGTRLSSIVELGSHVRLNRRDDPCLIDNSVYLFAGEGSGNTLELIVLESN